MHQHLAHHLLVPYPLACDWIVRNVLYVGKRGVLSGKESPRRWEGVGGSHLRLREIFLVWDVQDINIVTSAMNWQGLLVRKNALQCGNYERLAMSKRRAHYTVRIANMICEKIALGNSLKSALDEVGPLAPSMPTFWRWLDEYPEFLTRYKRARQMQGDIHADVMLDLAAEAINNPSKAAAIKVAADILKWQAEIRDPKSYSRSAIPDEPKKALSPAQLRAEIKALELDLGVKAVPGMNTAPNFTRKDSPAQTVEPNVVEETATNVSERTEDVEPEVETEAATECSEAATSVGEPSPAQIADILQSGAVPAGSDV